jgi:phosphoribosylglycinamide formyltransferase 1
MKRIVILISSKGSNMQAIVKACVAEQWPAQVVAVVSNRPQAQGLVFAQAQGIPTLVVDHQQYTDRAAFDAALANTLNAVAPDVVVLAGFMRVLGAHFVQQFAGKIVNIHPSLLPAFQGLHTHEKALQMGCKLAGATVHLVTEQLDHGPIIIQAVVPVLPADTAEVLAARVLKCEHHVYPRAVRWLIQNELQIDGGKVVHLKGEPQFLMVGD